MRPSVYTVPFALTGAVLIGMSAAPRAQRGRGGVEANGIPLGTNTIVQNPDTYYGKQITVSAAVEEMLSKTAFVLDQWRTTGPKTVSAIGKPILVIAPYLTASFEQRSYVLVKGELVKGDQATLARVKSDFNLDLASPIWAKYQGQPILLATSVITAAYKEVGKKPIPPPTPAEVALDAAMKSIGAAVAALRTGVQESQTEAAAKNAATLESAFTQAEKILDGLGQSQAAERARDARGLAVAIGRATAVSDWEAIKASTAVLNQACQNCHAVYRERVDDGSFRIKQGSS